MGLLIRRNRNTHGYVVQQQVLQTHLTHRDGREGAVEGIRGIKRRVVRGTTHGQWMREREPEEEEPLHGISIRISACL